MKKILGDVTYLVSSSDSLYSWDGASIQDAGWTQVLPIDNRTPSLRPDTLPSRIDHCMNEGGLLTLIDQSIKCTIMFSTLTADKLRFNSGNACYNTMQFRIFRLPVWYVKRLKCTISVLILPAILYGRETGSLTFGAENRPRVREEL
jgi:hypothetical protein